MMGTSPRVAFLTDCFHEVNGVALTSRQLDAYARRRGMPFFSMRTGPQTGVTTDGPVTTMEIKRSGASIPLDAGMHFDPLCLRYLPQVRRALRVFRPDVIHITGPGDCGLIGFLLSLQMRVPLVTSWHTNLHEFGARRLERVLNVVLPENFTRVIGKVSEGQMLNILTMFYSFGDLLLAPNPELIGMLERRTKRPAYLMQRGIDTELYRPSRRTRTDGVFTIGYTGRLSTEKNVRFLAEIERGLIAAGRTDYRFLIVGQGAERPWLEANLQRVEFTGVLKGEALAEAYANMDVFAFPSDTDTFGNVVMEALASGLPTIVTGNGGPKFLVREGVTGFVAHDAEVFIRRVDELLMNPVKRAAMSAAAREFAMGISWDSVFELVYAAYGKAAGFYNGIYSQQGCSSNSPLKTTPS
jgi:phosphatidylinositol alpha 1,6-mannosyltransferase